ncbi:MAG: PilZ domain-containing protein [Gammaproteobacteria bacterium]
MLLSLPEQQAIPGVDTRPGPLRDWLDALPYVDCEKTTAKVIERLRDINHQLIPAGLRLELLAGFRHAYERLHETLRDCARQQDMTQPRALELLAELTETLAFGHKYALRDALDERQRWGRVKQLAEAVNYSGYFLAQQLLCRYQAYHPVSDQHWRELGDLVRFAEAQNLPPTRDSRLPYSPGELHVPSGYVQLALLRLADPYRLPSGQIWETYGYLAGKLAQAPLLSHLDDEAGTPSGIYPVSLDREPQQALPAPRSGVERNSWRWIDARELLRGVQLDLERIAPGGSPHRAGFSRHLTAAEASQLLGRLLWQWTHSADRKSPRFNSTQSVEVAPGLAAAYYFLNGCQPFDPRDYAPPEDEDGLDDALGLRRRTAGPAEQFRLVSCPTRNRSGGGLALRLDGIHDMTLRVGDLLLLNAPGAQPDKTDWLLGVVRWLVRQDGAGAELGVQYVARNATPAVVRATSGTHQAPAPALANTLTLANGDSLPVLITSRGVYRDQSILELHHADQTRQIRQIRCERLLETASGYDRFSYDPLD